MSRYETLVEETFHYVAQQKGGIAIAVAILALAEAIQSCKESANNGSN